MRSFVLLALLFSFIGLSSSTIYWKNAITMDPKKELQKEIDWALQSLIDKDEQLYLELVQQGSSVDWFLSNRKDTIKNIEIAEAKFMDDTFDLVRGVGIVYGKSESEPSYVRLGMFKNGKSRTGYMMFDAVTCSRFNCPL